MKVRKAVIPAAGFGTRMLPATKAIPKELLPIVDKPAIQYIVEEAAASGIEEILIIISRGKSAIEDHFDRYFELEQRLVAGNKKKQLEDALKPCNLAKITFVRQQEVKGLGHAVSYAREFAAGEPVAVLYGDDVIMGDVPATKELLDAYEKYGKGGTGLKHVPVEQLSRYCSMKAEEISDGIYSVTDMIEKPRKGEEFTDLSILGRVVLPYEIFDILDKTAPGAGGEIQLTDAMKVLARTVGMTGVVFSGTRYDMGNKLGVMQAAVETAARHPEIGEDFKKYIKEFVKTL